MNRDQLLQHLSYIHGFVMTEAGLNTFLAKKVSEKRKAQAKVALENLDATKDQDAIDFTDNDITALANFPLSPRLHTLLLARNRVASIQPNLATSLPNLTTLVLTSNNFAELADLDTLRQFSKLTHLTLLENPVTRREIMGIKSRTFDIPNSASAPINGTKSYRVKLTDKEKKRVEELIRGAKSLQEISRLEKELNEGRIPGGAMGGGDDMEE
ncbi:U2 snRNP complex subunit [Xylographa soralifera]|nr:U2 snRNP complex subunit [Xylographa soralifera]